MTESDIKENRMTDNDKYEGFDDTLFHLTGQTREDILFIGSATVCTFTLMFAVLLCVMKTSQIEHMREYMLQKGSAVYTVDVYGDRTFTLKERVDK